ncbi:MAG TPA: hypothetical protein VFZ40_02645 [Pyrinomonadaceae bacterium]
MLSPKFRLALAVTLAGASLTFLAVTLNAAKTRESVLTTTPPLKAKILRSKDKLKAKLDAAETAALRKQAKGQDKPEERQLEDTTPKHVPIKLKIKAEKEKSFKDLNNDKWLGELEIEINNIGTKPIYFLAFVMTLPDVKGPSGNPMGHDFLYGRGGLISITEPIRPSDIPIAPGETHVFTMPERYVRGWTGAMRDHNLPQPKRVQIVFQFINFGDGTGFWGGTAAPLPNPKKKAFEKTCPDPHDKGRKERWPLVAFNGSLPTRWLKDLPAFLPANFLPLGENGRMTFDLDAEPDVCCPGSSCVTAKQIMDRCQCSDINNPEVNDKLNVSFTACSDPTGECSTISWSDDWCDFPNVDGTTFPISCRIPLVLSCLDYAPSPPPAPSPTASPSSATPTPTPTPEPTCDPATKPNNTNCICDTTPVMVGADPRWACGIGCNGATGADYQQPAFQGNRGCPPNKYNDGDCCRCIVTTCPNGQTANPATCECPLIEATPTPEGGGGDPSYFCTPYYWVWYVSYDGGETWEPTGQIEYAGCW